MGRRSPDRRAYPNRWSFPGGHVEAEEDLDCALQREIHEELGLTLRSFSFLTTIEIAKPAASFHLYTVTAWDGQPSIRDREHTELRCSRRRKQRHWMTLRSKSTARCSADWGERKPAPDPTGFKSRFST
ncbi:NUDIX domain-containing protein [Brucella intermedia]|uniref:NUDIX domain-containing protein n=1 Tax=Brucella intermedia TaxID=94625 RepID=UPI00209ABED4|nr:NUDIX domain-containing protein [Brucella intermedia]MCO7735089.1 NUDIX domain-containing protein [Brucella intermedia]WLF97732.1 NUDIX domain-containing protein [Brucella intermedia]